MNLNAEQGIIKKVKVYGDFFNEKDISEIERALENIPHEEDKIRKVFDRFEIDKYFHGMTAEDLLKAMF
jgi:lipoate-protein ligase A